MPNPDSIQKGWQYWVKFGDLLVSFYLGWTPPFSLGRALSSTLMFGSDHAIRDREDVIFWTCGGCFAHENSATFATWRLGLFWGSVQEEGKPHDSWVLAGQNLRSSNRLLVIVMWCTGHFNSRANWRFHGWWRGD